jgi:hypothetical protein
LSNFLAEYSTGILLVCAKCDELGSSLIKMTGCGLNNSSLIPGRGIIFPFQMICGCLPAYFPVAITRKAAKTVTHFHLALVQFENTPQSFHSVELMYGDYFTLFLMLNVNKIKQYKQNL